MIAFPGMLVSAAEAAGMKVPKDAENFDTKKFPRFNVFCLLQIGASMPSMSAHWDNAEVIAAITDEEMSTVTTDDLIERGLALGKPLL